MFLNLNKYCAISIFGFSVLFISCKKENKFEREEQIKMYLADEQNFDLLKEENVYVVVISGNCGSCNRRSIDVVSDLKKKGDAQLKVVLHKNFDDFIKVFDSLNVDTFYDKNGALMRYGLDFDKNLFLHYKSQELIYWNWLHLDRIYEVREALKLDHSN